MLVDLFRLSLRYWMPAMNPFILSSKLSSIIMGLYFSTVDQIGEAKVHVAYQLVNFEVIKYHPDCPVLKAYESLHSNLDFCRPKYNCKEQSAFHYKNYNNTYVFLLTQYRMTFDTKVNIKPD